MGMVIKMFKMMASKLQGYSIKSTIIVGLMVGIFFPTLISSVYMFIKAEQNAQEYMQKTVSSIGASIAPSMWIVAPDLGVNTIDAALTQNAEVSKVDAILVFKNGEKKPFTTSQNKEYSDKNSMDIANQVYFGDKLVGEVVVSFDKKRIDAKVFAERQKLYIISIIQFVLAMLIISPLLFSKIFIPIKDLIESAKKISNGELKDEIAIMSTDEFGQLAGAFENARLSLSRLFGELRKANEQIMDSIHYAARIQKSFLPSDDEIKHLTKDYFVISNPKDVVGGDFYWMQEYKGGYFIAAIDCTGHGVPGAFMTLIVSSLIEKILVEHDSISPAFILGELNRQIKNALGQNNKDGDSDDGCDGGMCYVDTYSKKVTFAGANTPLFIVQNGELIVVNSNKHSLGYVHSNSEFEYTDHVIDAMDGMSFYITTDGIVDQIGGVRSLSLGKKKLGKMLLDVAQLSMSKQKEELMKRFLAYKGDEIQRDDNTMIGFRV